MSPENDSRRTRRYVVGDPQASDSTFFEVLERYEILDDGGRLRDDVELISVGDHFDFGAGSERDNAVSSGLAILEWLASHDEDQVRIIAGNHDLGRVGELAGFDDETFARARAEAVLAYRDGDVDRDAEATFIERYPALPSVEIVARDFAAFSTAQRDLVRQLLGAGRLEVAVALDEQTLVCHAGITIEQLEATDLDRSAWSDARAVAEHLNQRLAEAARLPEPLEIPGLHRPGSAAFGEGVGMFYHRPANPEIERNAGYDFDVALARRYDPRRLVPGITQIVGHISDSKCRDLLGPWALGRAAAPGRLRHLVLGDSVEYRAGLPAPSEAPRTAMIFVDGGMSRVAPTHYQLLELSSLAVR